MIILRKKKLSKKLLGVFCAVAGAMIIIEVIPLFVWYIVLGTLFCGLVVFLIV